MIGVLEDDACLHTYPSLDAVVLAIEGLDADEVIRFVFDGDGQRYRVDWLKPNEYGASGVYRLVADGAPAPSECLAVIKRARERAGGLSAEGEALERSLLSSERR